MFAFSGLHCIPLSSSYLEIYNIRVAFDVDNGHCEHDYGVRKRSRGHNCNRIGLRGPENNGNKPVDAPPTWKVRAALGNRLFLK